MQTDILSDICTATGVQYTTNFAYLVDKIKELRIGSIRYDKVRHLNARQFDDIFKCNVQGRRFDDLVDEM
jgi:hypothetical protein